MNNNDINNIASTKERHLHIVCLDVPYPVDYGGVFDLFYKIKALNEAGIKIHLHCFEYGRGKQPELNRYCVEVKYYSRLNALKSLSFSVPYIAKSRANKELLKNLMRDSYPILMEGMHCTYFLNTGDLPGNRCFVRLHNVEYQYYRQLAVATPLLLKKLYYIFESRLLKKYEASLANRANFWTVTDKDMHVMIKEFGYHGIDYLPLFLPTYETKWSGDKGTYCLYHGNLSVPENEEAAVWLVENVFNKPELPFVIAGKKPSGRLKNIVHLHNHISIVANPNEMKMDELIRNAQVHVLPSLNSTGIKLKLINALYKGRHCVVNTAGVEGSGLDEYCVIANTSSNMRELISSLFDKGFSLGDYQQRLKKMEKIFDANSNARQIIKWIFEGEATTPCGAGFCK